MAASAVAAVLAIAHVAHAGPAPVSVRRDERYFRGRAHRATSGEILLWVPRVLLFPLYAVAEYAVREPVLATARWAERTHAGRTIETALHPAPTFWWSPSFVGDLGLLPEVGVRVRWDDALVPHQQLRAFAATGGSDAWHLAARDRIAFGAFAFGVRVEFVTRPDRPFFGIGPNANRADQTYVRLTRRESWAFFTWLPSPHVTIDVASGYRSEDTGPGWSPFVTARFQPVEVPGLGHVGLAIATADVALDSRRRRTDRTGIRFDLHALYAVDPLDPALQFAQGEAETEVAYGIPHTNHVVAFAAYGGDTHSMGREPVPFTDLLSLGGFRHVGFLWGRYVGASAVLTQVTYRIPIWAGLDAIGLASVGSVFGTHFEGFDPRAFTASFGAGLRSRIDAEHTFETLIAIGTTRFDEPAGIDTVRLVLSLNRGM